MGIGLGIFLIALGAILTFAVDWTVSGLDLHVVGRILMVAGVVGIILFFAFWGRRRAPQAVAAPAPLPVTSPPRTYDDPTPPPPSAAATTVSPYPPPAPATTVTATAPVVVSSQGRPPGD